MPAADAVTRPVEASMDATDGVLLVQVPAAGVAVSVAVLPAHATSEPEMTDGKGATVTTEEVIQPVPEKEYVTADVPAEMAVIAPVPDATVATEVVPLIHIPPAEDVDSEPDSPAQYTKVPVMADGSGFTVNTAVRTQPEADV